MKNVLTGVLLLVLVISFAVQRDYRFPHTNLLPDAAMAVLGVLSLWLVVQGWRGRRSALAVEEEEAALRWVDLGRAVALLAVWVLLLPWLGFVVGSIVLATVVTLTMRTDRITLRGAGLDLLVNAAVVLVIYLALTQVLYVRLPQFGGM